jgi:hypothetical protein
MSNHATISAALLAAFNLDTDKAHPAAVADAAASVLVEFAELVRGPAPVMSESSAAGLVAGGMAAIAAELRKQTTLLEVLAKQGDASRREFSKVTHSGDAISGLPG